MIADLTKSSYSAFIAQQGTVIVEFYANWCPDCQRLKQPYKEIAENLILLAKFGEVNIETQTDLASDNDVLSIPTIMIFKDGKEIDRFFEPSNEDLKTKINAALK